MSLRERYYECQSRLGKAFTKEEDFKIKVVVPYLSELGYSEDELDWERTIPVQVGTRTVSPKADIVVSIDGVPLMVIDTKNPTETLTKKDQLQAESYSKLISTPPAVYAVATSGPSTACINVFTGIRTDDIPSRSQLIRDARKYREEMLNEVQLREIKATLITLMSPKDFQKVVSSCKLAIEKNAGIRSDQSFREMTKVLLVKMAEERRTEDANPQPNRFTKEWFEAWCKQNEKTYVDALR